MKNKSLIGLLLASIILSACSTPSQSAVPEASESITASTTSTAATTTDEISETVAESTEVTYAPIDAQLDLTPAMPQADEDAMSDSSLVAEISEAMRNANWLEMILSGCDSVELSELKETVSQNAAYWSVSSSIPNEAALLEMFEKQFTDEYLNACEIPLNEALFGDTIPFIDENSSTSFLPLFKTVDGELLCLSQYSGVPFEYDFDNIVITSATDGEVYAAAKGTALAYENWSIITMKLVKNGDTWQVDELTEEMADWLGTQLENLLCEDNLKQLEQIMGNVTFIDIEMESTVEMFDNTLYYGVEPFMTISEMKTFVNSIFTEDIAQFYIDNYISIFREKGEMLYVPLYENKFTLGEFCFYKSSPLSLSGGAGSTNYLYAISLVPWDSGNGEYITIKVVIENTVNGLRIGSLLPSVPISCE